MKTNELDRDLQSNPGPIEKVIHDVEQALHDMEPHFSCKAPVGIFCFIGLLSVVVLVYRLFAG